MEFSILDNTQPIHVIPAYASVEEHALFTIASAEESYNRIMESVGIYELSLVMEGNENKEKLSIKNILKRFTDFVKELWQKFQDIVKTARDKFTAFVGNKIKAIEDKKFNPDDVKKAIAASKDERWNKDSVKNTVQTKLSGNGQYVTSEYIAKVDKALTDISGQVAKAVEDNAVDEIDVDGIFADAFKGISKETFADAAKLKDAIKSAIIDTKTVSAEEAKKIAGDNYVYYMDFFKKSISNFTNNIKSPYNATKKNFDKAIKEAQKISKEAENAKAFKPLFKSATASLKVSSCVVNAIESAFYAEFRYKFSVVLNALALTLVYKEKKEEVKKEATEATTDETTVTTESSVFQTELASLFTF